MKKIIFTIENNQKLHKLWRNFMQLAPNGFIYLDTNGNKIKFKNKSKRIKVDLMLFLWKIKKQISLLVYYYKIISEKKISKKIDLLNPDIIYCVNGMLYYGNKPWVVDFENPTAFLGFNFLAFKRYKNKIKNVLLKSNCKAIMAYSKTSKESFLNCFGKKDFEEKVHVVNNCIELPIKIKKIKHSSFNILFTGSINIEDNFYARGGREVVNSFLKLSTKHKDIKLIIRCKLPQREIIKLKGKNVEIYEEHLSNEEFEKLFFKSDIYILPAYIGYALSNLEAMSYGLPVITSDLLENGEFVEEGINGYKITPPKINYYFPGIPEYYNNAKFKFIYNKEYVNRIIDKIEYLYKNKEVIRKIRKNNLRKAKNYSIQEKNKKLEEIYKECLKNK
jgi:glycosyltransferase involved in cell wall biosynthesis